MAHRNRLHRNGSVEMSFDDVRLAGTPTATHVTHAKLAPPSVTRTHHHKGISIAHTKPSTPGSAPKLKKSRGSMPGGNDFPFSKTSKFNLESNGLSRTGEQDFNTSNHNVPKSLPITNFPMAALVSTLFLMTRRTFVIL